MYLRYLYRSIARDLGQILNSEGCLLNLKRISACGFHEKNSIKISDISDLNVKNTSFIIPTISALDHISTLVLTNQKEINFWQTGRIIKLDNYLNNFRGVIQQVPPKVSSVHVNGERAYKKVLKNEEFELHPREVEIEELVLKKWDQANGILEIKVSCTSGTYIRLSLIHI